jgi:hypothetical protein
VSDKCNAYPHATLPKSPFMFLAHIASSTKLSALFKIFCNKNCRNVNEFVPKDSSSWQNIRLHSLRSFSDKNLKPRAISTFKTVWPIRKQSLKNKEKFLATYFVFRLSPRVKSKDKFIIIKSDIVKFY